MMIKILRTVVMLAVVSAASAPGASAQDSPEARAKAVQLSRGWAAIAEANFGRAGELAAAMLREDPADHAALAVGVAAAVGAGRPTEALDAYDQWQRRTSQEDVFLLRPIAAGTLLAIAGGTDAGLAGEALSRLATGDPAAARAFLAAHPEGGAVFDPLRASLGDKAAAARIIGGLSATTGRERLLALNAARGLAQVPVEAVTPLLSDPAPPVRAAAVETLARVQGAEAAATLRPLLADDDPWVRANAAVA
ncbi:MAG TPA: HEAT repeat domain-containing protein, partial [Vicinamibacterales bacterium]|nr:HEAT repeat domain-containing protein [Vicinamibacterales bacterium]